MKKEGILNPELVSAIAKIGHTQMFLIGDAGLPTPDGVDVLDLSVSRGIPSFEQVLRAVSQELVIESYIYASECSTTNPDMEKTIHKILQGLPHKQVSHEEFKKLSKQARIIVRTGECSSYSNIILVAGVNF